MASMALAIRCTNVWWCSAIWYPASSPAWRGRAGWPRNVTINNLLPGFFDTDRVRTAMQTAAERSGKSVADLTAARAKTIPAQRLGIAGEFGEVCAFLCSAQAGYLTGQNILLDGGAYPGTF